MAGQQRGDIVFANNQNRKPVFNKLHSNLENNSEKYKFLTLFKPLNCRQTRKINKKDLIIFQITEIIDINWIHNPNLGDNYQPQQQWENIELA